MEKPKMRPITISLHSSLRKIVIEVLTDEALAWVEDRAREFGDLLNAEASTKKRGLWVYEGYSVSEVASYLMELWDAEHGASEEWPDEIVAESESK